MNTMAILQSYAAERRSVDKHHRLLFSTFVSPSRALRSDSFPGSAKPACHSKRNHQLQDVQHETLKLVQPVHCPSREA
jgi:hypothetical protein